MLELLTGIVIVLVAVFVIRRLLGIDRGRWLITVGAVIAGEAAATAILSAVYGGVSHVPAAGIVAGWALVTIFAMLVVVLVELLTGSRTRTRFSGVPRPIRQLRSMARRSLRYFEVARIVVHRGLLRPGDGADGDMGGSRLGRSLRLTFEDAGGLFVKLGQAMAQQPQLVTQPVAAELAFLHDSATPADPVAARAVIAEELGPPEEVFAQISSVPLGAASIGQTYSARLPDERDVVITVQRPGVAESIECDLDILAVSPVGYTAGRSGLDRSGCGSSSPALTSEPGRSWISGSRATADGQHVAHYVTRIRSACRLSSTASPRLGCWCRNAPPAGVSARRERLMAGIPSAASSRRTHYSDSCCGRCWLATYFTRTRILETYLSARTAVLSSSTSEPSADLTRTNGPG